ncbi:MAG TPA: hypothetical protein VFR81_15595 [Longimicrobium sp.]|nr:hypothetical protein [Longimicrobium sp.]
MPFRRLSTLLPLAGAALAGCAAPAAAQGGDGPPWTGGAGVRLESYAFRDADLVGIERISLLTVPLAAEARVGRGVRVTLAGGFASARLTRADGGESALGGLTDTELRVAVPLAGDWLTLTGVAVLPTGKETLSAEELEVAAIVASDLLPFAVSHWGSGGGIGASLSVARRFGAVGVGASGGYRASREYRAFEGGGAAYRPGNEAFLRLAVDRALGPGTATLQAGAHRYAHDELEGGSLYRSGGRYQLIGSYALSGRGRAGVVYAGVLHRENGTRLAAPSLDLPSQDLVLLGGGLRLPVGRGAVLPGVDGRIFHAADGVGQGWGIGAGASAEVPAGGVTLVPSARLRLGRVVVVEGAESPFTGVELGFTLRRGRR